jgi:hypothetical protein
MALTMKIKYSLPILLALGILVAACGQPTPATPPVDAVATIVAATMDSLTPQNVLDAETLPAGQTDAETATQTPPAVETGTPTITATPGAGLVSGGVFGYSYGALPRLVVVAFNEDHLHWNYVITDPGSSYYSMELTEGKYQIVAYDADGHAGGCITIATVKDKQTATCDITDWTGTYPLKPNEAPNP